MRNLLTWKMIDKSLRSHIPVMLLYVLESVGSSPGRQGFFMAVNASGEMQGSIGGGIMEHKFVEMAREMMKSESPASEVKKQVHDKSASKNRSGMICSGEQRIFIYPIRKDDEEAVHAILQCLEDRKNGRLMLSPKGIEFTRDAPPENFHLQWHSEDDWLYSEKLGYQNRLFIIGGGHCSLALSKLMSSMDFYIQVFDDRKDLLTMDQNRYAHEKTVVENYQQLQELVPAGTDHYIVIMTFGYRTDAIALKALLDKKFKYLGVLGSRNKIVQMFEDLTKEGISEEQLSRIHSPIGIDIKSETPEEIAISIAAEIIKVKNGQSRRT